MSDYEERQRKRMRKVAELCKGSGCIYYEDIPDNIIGLCHHPGYPRCWEGKV